jgi:hypothetical protein
MTMQKIEVVRPGTGRKVIRLAEWPAHRNLGFVPLEGSPEEADAASASLPSAGEMPQESDAGLEGVVVPDATPDPGDGDDAGEEG